MGVSFEVGLDPHRVFAREAENHGSNYGRHMKSVADHVQKGGSLADAIKAQGNYFPDHFGQMVEAGERAGRLDRVLDRLAEYYQQLADFRRIFVNSIIWPMIQLMIAVLVIGLMIYLPSVIVPTTSEADTDLLGIGLVGERGVMIYAMLVAVFATVIFALIWMMNRGVFNFALDWLARVPVIGPKLRIFAEARFVQTLALAIESGLDAWSAVDLSFRSAGTPQFEGRAKVAKEAILQGREIHVVMDESGLFQKDTIEAVELGEASGRLSETLDKHFSHLKTQVRSSMGLITYLASAIIWAAIAAVLILIIFRVFSLYINNIGDAAVNAIDPRTDI
ncbi:type II secretion system F family protein [Stieleria sp. JC731]|uniref:type II secretion system F family protein n=1 Tax=Stieleria sp. JC731 TaxID=2894195 RepID=UPI001E3DB49D|nr:type II secretion system F family protein [Stieleria sp. JC731]MCC9603569.1 type II secretion system F family protein [Stieleria sp. JC731]